MDSLGNFPFAVTLSEASLAGILVANEVLNQQFALTPPSAGALSCTGIPINFAATVDGQQVAFKRDPIGAGSIALVDAASLGGSYIQSLWALATGNAPPPTTATDPPQPPAVAGKGAVTIQLTGQATVNGATVPFAVTLALFIRQARALEVTPAGFPALRAAATPAFSPISDVIVAINGNSQPVPADSGFGGVMAGDLIRQFNPVDGIHDGLPLDQSIGTGLTQPTITNSSGQQVQKYVIATNGGIAQLVDPTGKVVAQQYGGTGTGSNGLLQVFLDVVGASAFQLNGVPVNDVATAVQAMLGESASAGFNAPSPFAYRVPLDVFPAFGDPLTIRSAVAGKLDSVILDPITGTFCTTTAWALLQLAGGPGTGIQTEAQLKQNLPAPPLGDLLLVDAAVVGNVLVAGLQLGLMPQNFPYGMNPIPLTASVCGAPGPYPNPSQYPGVNPAIANTASLSTSVPVATDSTQINLPAPSAGASDFLWAMSQSILRPQLNALIPTVLSSNDPMSIANPGESRSTVLSSLSLESPVAWGASGPSMSIGGRFAYPLYLNITVPFTSLTTQVFLRYLHGSFTLSGMAITAGVTPNASAPGIGCGLTSLGRAFCDPQLGTCPVSGLTPVGPFKDCYNTSSLPPPTPPNASTPPMTRINDLAVSMTGGQMNTTLDPGDEAYVVGLAIVIGIGSILDVVVLATLLPALINALSTGQSTAPSGPPQGRSAWARAGLANAGGLGTLTVDLYTQSAQFTGDGLVLGCRLVAAGSLNTLAAVVDTGSACLIATATFGTPLHPKVASLRSFRDTVLMRHAWGRFACAAYLNTSPPLAALLRRSERLRRVVRPSISWAAGACERWLKKRQ